MRRIFTMICLALAAGACSDHSDRSKPKLPDDRAPTIEELSTAVLDLVLSYPGHPVPQWAAWEGTAKLELGGPEAGLDHLPAALSLLEGFEDLDGCLSSADGRWEIQPDGTFVVTLGPEGDGATLTLDGKLVIRYRYSPDGKIVGILSGSGPFTVSPGIDCEPDDFAGGLVGTWSARLSDDDSRQSLAGRDRGPHARLLIISDDGSVRLEVDGPASKVASLVGAR